MNMSLGFCEILKDLKESYVLSCQHNDVSVDDFEYFREYTFLLIAGIIKTLGIE